jgi:hypothetical protein
MNRLDSRLLDVLEPVRDIAVGEILEVMARRLDSGAHVIHEPMQRDADGHVTRSGKLRLPVRGDLEVTAGGRTLVQRVACEKVLNFEPLTLIEPDGFVAVLKPFRWDAADVLVEARQATPNWTPVRRWYLEWFQSRFSELAPDLDGAVHGIDGPNEVPEGWRFTVDFGSAPIEALTDMVGAFAETGAARIRIGQPPE